ncbi:hypothetical protein BLX87_04150 [Bacillus sp. VT-16-64]|nr:hypothetical protein BLX87_04150 [Bacillus sp. VT-16-64]
MLSSDDRNFFYTNNGTKPCKNEINRMKSGLKTLISCGLILTFFTNMNQLSTYVAVPFRIRLCPGLDSLSQKQM